MHRAMFRPRSKNLQTFRIRSPLEDIDIDMPNAPSFHLEPTRLMEIDGIRPDKRGTVIINNVFFLRPDDSEARAEWEY